LVDDLLNDWLKCFISQPLFSRTSVAERYVDPHKSSIRIKALFLIGGQVRSWRFIFIIQPDAQIATPQASFFLVH
jgi:hypothetical protein